MAPFRCTNSARWGTLSTVTAVPAALISVRLFRVRPARTTRSLAVLDTTSVTAVFATAGGLGIMEAGDEPPPQPSRRLVMTVGARKTRYKKYRGVDCDIPPSVANDSLECARSSRLSNTHTAELQLK